MYKSIFQKLAILLTLALLLSACSAPTPTATSTPPPPTDTVVPPTATPKPPTATPPPLTRPMYAYYHMVYDSVAQSFLLIGKEYADVDVWAYDVANQKLSRLPDKPAVTVDSVVYNPIAGGAIASNNGTKGTTWLINSATKEWQELASGKAYGESAYAASALDTESQKMIIIGGTAAGGETMLYDATADSWEYRALDPNPSWSEGRSMVYDAESDRILFWDGVVVKRMWVFDADKPAWEETTYEGGPKPGCRFSAMAYVPDLDRSYLYCAENFYAYDYNTNQWEKAKGELKPGSREGLSMAYDPINKKLAIYGGWGYNDLWLYDPQSGEWTLVGLE